MKKIEMKKIGFVLLVLFVSLSMLFLSCGDDSDNGDGVSPEPDNWLPLTDGNYSKFEGETDATIMGQPCHLKFEYTIKVIRDTSVEGSKLCKAIDEIKVMRVTSTTYNNTDSAYTRTYHGMDDTYYRAYGDEEETSYDLWEKFFVVNPKIGDFWYCTPLFKFKDDYAEIVAFETVINKTGRGSDFTNCAKTEFTSKDNEKAYYWFCKNIGLVKMNRNFKIEETSEEINLILELKDYQSN